MHCEKANKTFLGVLSAMIIGGCIAHYATSAEKNTALQNSSSFERGKNLAFNICGQCHYDESLKHFTGKLMDLPGFMGKIYSANLTHSLSYGILNKYTDAEIFYLLKTGVARDGRYVPYMIRPNLADDDINDLLVYLRSHDTAVSPKDTVPGKTHVNLLGKLATKVAGKPLPYNKGVLRPKEADAVSYGKYLVDNLACYHCHSKSVLGLDYLDPEKSKGYMQGGFKFKIKKGKNIYAANLTPDKETGIGNYTKENFHKALVKGIKPGGDSLRLPMPKFKHLTTKQSDALFAYLQSLKPVKNKVKR